MDSPAPKGEVTTHSAEQAYNKVLAYVGASLYRDEVDARYVEETKTGTATYKGSVTKSDGIIDLVSDVNGYTETNFGKGSRPSGFDSDKDGIPDEWEKANGLNPNDAKDALTYSLDAKGYYTNIEVYANSLVENIMKEENKDAIESIDEYYPSVKTTGIEETLADGNSSHSAIARVEYFSLNGTKLATPTKGVNIRQTTLANGKVVTDKVIK